LNFTKELRQLAKANEILEQAHKKVADRFVIEVKKMLAKYKKYNYDFTCGNGTFFFSKDGEIVHASYEEKLPPDMKELCTFLEDNDYILKYVSTIKLGGSHELNKQQTSKRS